MLSFPASPLKIGAMRLTHCLLAAHYVIGHMHKVVSGCVTLAESAEPSRTVEY